MCLKRKRQPAIFRVSCLFHHNLMKSRFVKTSLLWCIQLLEYWSPAVCEQSFSFHVSLYLTWHLPIFGLDVYVDCIFAHKEDLIMS